MRISGKRAPGSRRRAAALAMLPLPLLLGGAAPAPADRWRSLLNFRDFSGWERWLTIPKNTYDVPGMKRGADGRYHTPIGADRDPLGVFSFATVQGVPVLRISGQVRGAITTRKVWSNYRFRMVFKWGDGRWDGDDYPRNTGIMFHAFGPEGGFGETPDALPGSPPAGAYMNSVEFELVRGGMGDMIPLGPIEAMIRAVPADNPTYSPLNSWRFRYDPKAAPLPFGALNASPNGRRVHFATDPEKPRGAWNVAELACYADRCAQIINGRIVAIGTGLRYRPDPAGPILPLTGGRIQIESEGAELFVRAIEIRPLHAVPPELIDP